MNSSGGKFRVWIWDPKLIISQILALQSLYYAAYGGILVLLVGIFTGGSEHPSLSYVFSYKSLNFSDRAGMINVISYVLSSSVGALGLWKIVRRTKQCLDFTVTTFLFHLLICWIWNGWSLPSTFSWWTLTLVSITIMTVGGEFFCLKSELEDIPLIGGKIEV